MIDWSDTETYKFIWSRGLPTPKPPHQVAKKVHGGLMWLATSHVAHLVTHQQPINIIIIITITIIIIIIINPSTPCYKKSTLGLKQPICGICFVDPDCPNIYKSRRRAPQTCLVYLPFFYPCSILAIYLPYAPDIWSNDPNIWVHRRQIYNIWHPLTKSFPKIYTLCGQNGQFCYFCSILAIYLPYAPDIWSHDPNIWVHRRQIYNIWHPLTKSFPKIYTLWGQNGQFGYHCLTSAVQFPTSHSRFWVKIAWPKSERAQPKLAINFYWDKQIPSSLAELWATKKIPETGCFDPSILFL